MNGPRHKTEDELQWDTIKRAVTARINFEFQSARARALNAALCAAWDEFEEGVEDRVLLEVDPTTILEPGVWVEPVGLDPVPDEEGPTADEMDEDFAARLMAAADSYPGWEGGGL